MNALHDKQHFGGNGERAIQRDGERCVECGMSRQEHRDRFGLDISVDHIDMQGRYSKTKNHKLSNLRTLCLPCHGRLDCKKRGDPLYFRKLTFEQVANILHVREVRPDVTKLCRAYGVSRGTGYNITNRSTYPEVTQQVVA